MPIGTLSTILQSKAQEPPTLGDPGVTTRASSFRTRTSALTCKLFSPLVVVPLPDSLAPHIVLPPAGPSGLQGKSALPFGRVPCCLPDVSSSSPAFVVLAHPSTCHSPSCAVELYHRADRPLLELTTSRSRSTTIQVTVRPVRGLALRPSCRLRSQLRRCLGRPRGLIVSSCRSGASLNFDRLRNESCFVLGICCCTMQ
jgi:hypothetical protein